MKVLINYTIEKEEIVLRDFSRFERSFSDWPRLRGADLRAKYDSLLISVDGYNNHPEEIYMIPPVRRYFRELHQRWPWFFFFLYDYGPALALPYLCLAESVKCIRGSSSNRCRALYNPAELLPYLHVDFARMNQLFECAGFAETEIEKRTRRIFETFLPQASAKK